MGLSNALHIAYTGLAVSTLRTNVAANNIANASTEGYVRRELEVSSIALDGFGAGVVAEGVKLATNPGLTADRREADAEAGRATVIADAQSVLVRLVGEPADPGAMTERYSDFEGSLRAFADDPGQTFLQNDVITSAEFLLDGFADMQRDILDLREEADREIDALVKDINLVLEQIATLNDRIKKTNNVNGDIGEMQAERGRLIDEITEALPVTVYETDYGAVLLTTANGQVLVSETGASPLSYSPVNSIDASANFTTGVGGLSALTLGSQNVDITPTTTGALTEGRLAALFEVRDDMGVEFQEQIDAMAQDLINRFEDVDPTAESIFVDPGAVGTPGVAGRIALNAAVDPEQGGAAWRLRDGVGATAEGDSGDNSHAQLLLAAMTENRTYSPNTASSVHITSAETDILENGAALYTASSEAADKTGQAAVYSLTEDVGGLFAIDATTGAVTATGALANDTTYNVTIQAIAGHDATIVTSTLTGTAPVYSLTVDAGGLFEVDAATGAVSLVAGQTINFETATDFSITIQQDDGGVITTETVTITPDEILETDGISVLTETVTVSVGDRVGMTGSYSAFELAASFTSLITTNSVNADREASLMTSYRTLLADQELSETGVNLDRELAQLQEIQTAYAANARVVQVIDELMRILREI